MPFNLQLIKTKRRSLLQCSVLLSWVIGTVFIQETSYWFLAHRMAVIVALDVAVNARLLQINTIQLWCRFDSIWWVEREKISTERNQLYLLLASNVRQPSFSRKANISRKVSWRNPVLGLLCISLFQVYFKINPKSLYAPPDLWAMQSFSFLQ